MDEGPAREWRAPHVVIGVVSAPCLVGVVWELAGS